MKLSLSNNVNSYTKTFHIYVAAKTLIILVQCFTLYVLDRHRQQLC